MGNDFINVRMYYVGKLEELEKLVIIYLVSEGFLRKECLHWYLKLESGLSRRMFMNKTLETPRKEVNKNVECGVFLVKIGLVLQSIQLATVTVWCFANGWASREISGCNWRHKWQAQDDRGTNASHLCICDAPSWASPCSCGHCWGTWVSVIAQATPMSPDGLSFLLSFPPCAHAILHPSCNTDMEHLYIPLLRKASTVFTL